MDSIFGSEEHAERNYDEEMDLIPGSPTDASPLGAIHRGTLVALSEMAQRNPRSISAFMKEARGMIEYDARLAAKCWYTLERRNERGEKVIIQGPSIRLAEIILSTYKHLWVFGRPSGDDGKFVSAQGIAIDLERNTCAVIETRRRVTRRDGRRYSDDMVGVTTNAAVAFALRNCLFRIVPKAFVQDLMDHAKRVAVGTEKTLPKRRADALAWFRNHGVETDRILAGLGRTSVDEIGLQDLEVLIGLATALQEGRVSADNLFGEQDQPGDEHEEELPKDDNGKVITQGQMKRLWAAMSAETFSTEHTTLRDGAPKLPEENLAEYLQREHGIESKKQIPTRLYDSVIAWVLMERNRLLEEGNDEPIDL